MPGTRGVQVGCPAGMREGVVSMPIVDLDRSVTELRGEEPGQEVERCKYGRGELCELFKGAVFVGC